MATSGSIYARWEEEEEEEEEKVTSGSISALWGEIAIAIAIVI